MFRFGRFNATNVATHLRATSAPPAPVAVWNASAPLLAPPASVQAIPPPPLLY